jgi:hypothetical protein
MKQGQAVLIVLLVAAVALVFGLSIISQSTTDVRISQHENEAARAFNAAEAGIEDALKQINTLILGVPQALDVNNIPVSYEVNGQTYLEGVYKENETATVMLGGVINTITIEWGEDITDCSEAAALEITIIDVLGNTVKQAVNACYVDNHIIELAADPISPGYFKSYGFFVGSDDRLIRIRPIYNQTKLKVSGLDILPIQAYQVNSEAQSPSLESKAISVSRTEPATPSIFDYVLFSGINVVR